MASMISLSEIMIKALNDKEYRKKLAQDSKIDMQIDEIDKKISEDLFLLLIKAFKKNKELFQIYENMDYLINIEENITDKIFWELISYAKKHKKKCWFIFLDLCHIRNLKSEQIEYLKSLKFLNESFFY